MVAGSSVTCWAASWAEPRAAPAVPQPAMPQPGMPQPAMRYLSVRRSSEPAMSTAKVSVTRATKVPVTAW